MQSERKLKGCQGQLKVENKNILKLVRPELPLKPTFDCWSRVQSGISVQFFHVVSICFNT